MFPKILEIDRYLFLKINRDLQNSTFDFLMPLFRNPFFWIPLYLFLILYVGINFKSKALMWVGFAFVTASATDFISSKIIKPYFARPRPCIDPDFYTQVRMLAKYCGGNGSFTSSHAANHFGLAMFIVITIGFMFPKFKFLFFLWATIICVAQIYVGVHYPSDIVGGAILGTSVGYFMGVFFNKNYFLSS